MINHVRTMLLNLGGASGPPADFPGEEYVPPAFVARNLSPALTRVRRILFGVNPDRSMLNYRLRQVMGLLHASELSEFVLAKDPRVTYLPFTDALLKSVVRGPVSTQVAGAAGQFYLLKSFPYVQSPSRLFWQWRVEVVDGSNVKLDGFNEQGVTQSTNQTYSTSNGLSSVLALGDSGMTYRFGASAGAVWLVEVLARPTASLVDVVRQADRLLSEEDRLGVFGDTSAEPYATFRHLWERHDVLAYRLGALALALAYRTEEES